MSTKHTDEDIAILARMPVFAALALVDADSVDFRAMLAIECHVEREWRVNGRAMTPADCLGVHGYANGRNLNLRETYELAHGKNFA